MNNLVRRCNSVYKETGEWKIRYGVILDTLHIQGIDRLKYYMRNYWLGGMRLLWHKSCFLRMAMDVKIWN